jgi:hypothetical protein
VEDKTSKELWPSLDAFQELWCNKGNTTTQNNETARLTSQIVKQLSVINVAPNGGSAKVTIMARLLDSFARKETNTKRVRPWLLSQPHFEASVRMKLTLPKVGTWSPLGLPKIQSLISRVKTPRIEMLFIPL